MKYYVLMPDNRISNSLSFTADESKIKSNEPFIINIGKTSKLDVVDMVTVKIIFVGQV